MSSTAGTSNSGGGSDNDVKDEGVLSIRREAVLQILRQLADDNQQYFEGARWYMHVSYQRRFADICANLLTWSAEAERLIDAIQRLAPLCDYDIHTPGNGYRSIICIMDTCILHVVRLLRHVQQQRTSLMFRTQHYCKELEAYAQVFHFMIQSMRQLNMYSVTRSNRSKGELFPVDQCDLRHSLQLMRNIDLLDNSCFYGRALGFQFAGSVGRLFHVIGIVLAAYSVQWERGGKTSLASLLHSGRFVLSAEQRAKRIIKVTREADITLCKGFWNLSEEGLYYKIPSMFAPSIAINCVVTVGGIDEPQWVAHRDGVQQVKVEVPSAHTGPRPVTCRVLSSTIRPGHADWLANHGVTLSSWATTKGERSPNLLFHVHGGGFVATSTKSHETYLRVWCAQLDCPIISVEYSLAPENPYPRPTEEVLYAYAWAINNADKLGWTGEKIVFVGDSAGGNLIMSTVLRCISLKLARLPTAMVQVYTPFMFAFAPSPSRLLHMMDPLLHMGIVSRCVAAYTSTSFEPDSQGTPDQYQTPNDNRSHKTLQEYCDEVRTASEDKVDANDGKQPITALLNIEAMCSSDTEEKFHTPTEDKTQTEENDEELAAPSNFAQKIYAAEKSHLEVHAQVSVAEDTSRIWLTHVDAGDEDFVRYLTEHPLLRRTDDVQRGAGRTSTDDTSAPLTTRTMRSNTTPHLHGTPSSSPPRHPPAISSPAKSVHDTNKLRSGHDSEEARKRTISQSFAETVALATGHLYDNLTGLVDTAAPMMGLGGDGEFRQPLQRSDSLGAAIMQADGAKDQHSSENDAYEKITMRLSTSPVLRNPEISPLYADAAAMRQLPPLFFICGQLDPLLDDTIAFARHARHSGARVRRLQLLDALPHGFLNFTAISPECRTASKHVLNLIRVAFDE